MAPLITLSSTFDEAAARFGRMATAAAAAQRLGLADTAEAAGMTIAATVEQATVDAVRGGTGALAQSTRHDVTLTPDGAEIAIRQTERSQPGKNGGGGFPYWLSVDGGRKAITAPSAGDWAGDPPSRALFIPGYGYRKSVRAFAGYHYVAPAIAAASGPLVTILNARAAAMARSALEA